MGGFNFEDYRQPWETGPHWELKREFMEKYRDMFSEDRLLCLAQAYSNIVLMNCSYPDPVMRQISLLSEPLQMRKKFQGASDNSNAESPKQEDRKVSEKMKSIYQNSGRPFKQIKFCTSEEQEKSVDSPVSAMLPQNSLQENVSINTSLMCSQVVAQPESSSILKTEDNQIIVKSSPEPGDILIKKSVIISVLGLDFIKKFIQEFKNFQVKQSSPILSLTNTAQCLKIAQVTSFQTTLDPNSPPCDPIYCSQFSINNCIISSEKERSKKRAKLKSANAAVDILLNIANQGIPKPSSDIDIDVNLSSGIIHSSSVSNQPDDAIKHMDIKNSRLIKQKNNAKNFSSNYEEGSVMYLLATLNEKMEMLAKERIHKQYPFNAFMDAAASLNLRKFIKYECTQHFKTPLMMLEFECKLFFKNVLISIAKDMQKKSSAKASAVVAGLKKLKHLSNYKIRKKQLVECGKSNSNETGVSVNPHSSNEVISGNVFEKPAFVLNQSLFQASLKDNFVLLDNLAFKTLASRTLKSFVAESATFSRKTFKYNCEDVPGTNLKKVDILIQDEVVGTGTASVTVEAKDAAAYNAVEMLRKKYYTIRMKNEYDDGFIITQNQVLDGESFSSTALTDHNIGCRMLKNMGWTGGGLGTSGISEPVEAYGQHAFKQGLGYGQKKGDKSLFRKKIHSMLQEYNKSNSLSDLIFSKEFSKEERKEIHQIAGKYKLHTASRGIDDNRFLSVRRKYTAMEVLMYLVNAGGSNSKFELVDASKGEKFDTDACVMKHVF